MGICISKKKSLRQFRFTANSTAGKASGRTTIYHRGGGKRRLFRVIDYYRYFWNVPGLVVRFDYNPVSNMVLALISYVNGVLCYIACPKGLHVGDFIQNLTFYEPGRPGIANYLKTIPVGTFVHHLELKQFLGSQYLRAYGAYGRVMSRDANLVYIKLRSSKIIGVPVWNFAVIGILLPSGFVRRIHKKAGFFRSKGRRPCVRGVAMNPVDHPHGGGEGKSSGGRLSVSRWGWLTKNVKK